MTKQPHTAELALASHLGKLLRDSFGRGPQSIFVNMRRPFVVVYLRNFLTPIEKILLQEGQDVVCHETRDIIMHEYLIPEIKTFVRSFFGVQIEEFYYDWGFHNYTGVLVWKETDESGESIENMNVNDRFPGKEQLHEEVTRIRQLPHGEEMHSCIINNRTLLMIRKGILIEIEREFIRLGHENVLKTAKRSLEKKFLLHNANIGTITNQTVSDVYVDWNFQLDKSVWIFIFQAKP